MGPEDWGCGTDGLADDSGMIEFLVEKNYFSNVVADQVTIMDQAGNVTYYYVNVGDIDTTKPNLEVKYSEEEPTTESVTVMITSNEVIREEEEGTGWKEKNWKFKDETHKVLQKTFTENTTEPEYVTISDLAGNTQTVKIEVKNIDIKTLQLVVTYDPPEPNTAEQVKATIKSQNGEEIFTDAPNWDRGEDGTSLTKTYQKSTSESVVVRDSAGNAETVTIEAFCKTTGEENGPELTVSFEPETKTNESVTVIIKSKNDEVIHTDAPGWTPGGDEKSLTKSFEENADESVTVKNASEKGTTVNISVTNIDKEAPTVIERDFAPEGKTNDKVTVTLTLNEEVKLPEGWISRK